LIQRLMLEGFVTQKRGYRATLRLAVLGRQMLEHHPLTQAATPRVAQLAHDTRCVAHLWIRGYDEHVVCALRADGRTDFPAVSVLCDVAPASLSAAGTVLLPDRADQWSSCYVQHATEPTFAAAVVKRGHVVAALGVTGDRALAARAAVVTTAARLSAYLGSRPRLRT
jgi:DNA-binding IclR family transcriptional regulator